MIERWEPRITVSMSRSLSRRVLWRALLVSASLLGCSSESGSSEPTGAADQAGGGAASSGNPGTSGAPSAGGPLLDVGGGPHGAAGGGNDEGEPCATVSAAATLETVHLVFAFDVSGSMGKGDYPWHDAKLKWEPVVAATRGFFEDPASAGLQASLKAFPIDEDEDERCDASSYTEPDVEMQELPSPAFGEELADIRDHDWRGGTPTLAVIRGSLDYIERYRQDHPGRYALVLVTDGYPQGCDDDSIDSVKDAVEAVASDVPTYVIGVKNPPLVDDDGDAAPDTVSNLAEVARAGGTGEPFIVETGEADATISSFRAAIDEIRGVSLSCNLELPAPPDRRGFEKDRVAVSYSSAGTRIELGYDESCAGDASWHYDDLAAPSEVVLCPATCAAVQAAPEAALDVAFTCQPVIQLPR